MTAKEGLDGSGRHAVYDQLGNVQTHNIIIWMWVPLQLSKNSDQDLNAIMHAPLSPLKVRLFGRKVHQAVLKQPDPF